MLESTHATQDATLPIDVPVEDLIDLDSASKLFPRNHRGKRPTRPVIWRWCSKGVAQGTIKLRYVAIGRRFFTSRKWIAEFVVEQNRRRETPPLRVVHDSSLRPRLAPHDVADRELREAGL